MIRTNLSLAVLVLAATSFLAFPGVAQAAIGGILPESGYGVSAGVSDFNNCPSFCTGAVNFDSDGGEFEFTASASSNTYGEFRASANYDATSSFLPILKAYAGASPTGGSSASAFGIQTYIYEGAAAKAFTLDFELDAVLAANGGSATATGEVAVFLGTTPFFTSDFGTLLFEGVNPADQLGDDSIFFDTVGSQSDTGSLTFTVEPGDIFSVAAGLRSSVRRGGLVDAENTFTSSFTDDTGLTPVAVPNAVPEPTSLVMLGFCTLALAARRSRG